MIKVGLTGGIGSGKSTISAFLKELGYKVIDADLISREVLVKYADILKKIKDEFSSIIFQNGELSRKKLGEIVFKDKIKKEKLEGIVMPYIIKEIFEKFSFYDGKDEEIVFLDAPTLIENELHKRMDVNILIYASEAVQIERIKKRDNLNEKEIRDRMSSQMSTEEKKSQVDFIINNDGDIEFSKKEMIKVINGLRGRNET